MKISTLAVSIHPLPVLQGLMLVVSRGLQKRLYHLQVPVSPPQLALALSSTTLEPCIVLFVQIIFIDFLFFKGILND